jgi:hypothetical protein
LAQKTVRGRKIGHSDDKGAAKGGEVVISAATKGFWPALSSAASAVRPEQAVSLIRNSHVIVGEEAVGDAPERVAHRNEPSGPKWC